MKINMIKIGGRGQIYLSPVVHIDLTFTIDLVVLFCYVIFPYLNPGFLFFIPSVYCVLLRLSKNGICPSKFPTIQVLGDL